MKVKKLLELFLPEGMLRYFEIVDLEETSESYLFSLEELNIPPEEYQGKKLVSKGFYEPVIIQDFPLRGKSSHLKVKRRRWLVEETGDIVSRDWEIVAKGTRITQEFATFLKELN